MTTYKSTLLRKLEAVSAISNKSKMGRLLANPYRYLNSVAYRIFFYSKSQKEKEVVVSTFFDHQMNILLPSSTDIYLTGGKCHDSEIRLAMFIINQVDKGDVFIDVGAHYGYFSLLSSEIVGPSGQVESFEAAPKTYSVLKKNAALASNINSHHYGVSDSDGVMEFFEFPNLYSEYNTMDPSQFENDAWYTHTHTHTHTHSANDRLSPLK